MKQQIRSAILILKMDNPKISKAQIAVELNFAGLTTQRGFKWSKNNVSFFIKNNFSENIGFVRYKQKTDDVGVAREHREAGIRRIMNAINGGIIALDRVYWAKMTIKNLQAQE